MKKATVILTLFLILMTVSCTGKKDELQTNKINTNEVVLKALDLPKDYSFEKAAENGDVVNIHGRITNLEKLDQFIENVEKGIFGLVRITSFTIEGDPIITVLYFNGEEIEFYDDNTRDKFGTQTIESATGKMLKKERKVFEYENGSSKAATVYTLYSDTGTLLKDILLVR